MQFLKQSLGKKFMSSYQRILQMVEAKVERNTNETKILIRVNLDGTGKSDLSTGIGFFDHMLHQIARHGKIDLEVKVEGDLYMMNTILLKIQV